VVTVIELFVSGHGGVWSVAWRAFDDFGVIISEGLVSGPAAANARSARAQLRSIWVDLLTARFEIEMAGDAICVTAHPRVVERAIGRKLMRPAKAALVV
jgi:hypothetical protein